VFEPHVLVQHEQLETFVSATESCLTTMVNAGDPGAKDVAKALKDLKFLATALNINETIDEHTPLNVILSYAGGFPVKSKIFEKSVSDVTTMGQDDFKDWVKNMEASTKVIKDILSKTNLWISLGDAAQPLREQHAFVRVRDLP
jgi:hypothetical protein